MVSANTDLPIEAYVSSPSLLALEAVVSSPFLPIGWVARSKPLKYRSTKRTGTPVPRNIQSLSVIPLPAGSNLGDWRLKLVLVVRVEQVRGAWLATTWLERDLEEFGTGGTVDGAVRDLIDSIGEAGEVLERRRANLADSAVRQLDVLKSVVERVEKGAAIGLS